jgi:hypothetical protein
MLYMYVYRRECGIRIRIGTLAEQMMDYCSERWTSGGVSERGGELVAGIRVVAEKLGAWQSGGASGNEVRGGVYG